MQDDLGEANGRMQDRPFRGQAERAKSSDAAHGYAPRRVPTGNSRISLGNVMVVAIGAGSLLMVSGMKLPGFF